jgi:hypothetical protein
MQAAVLYRRFDLFEIKLRRLKKLYETLSSPKRARRREQTRSLASETGQARHKYGKTQDRKERCGRLRALYNDC